MVEPSHKKRKLDGDSLAKQDSFSDILQQLEAEGDITGGEHCFFSSFTYPPSPAVSLTLQTT